MNSIDSVLRIARLLRCGFGEPSRETRLHGTQAWSASLESAIVVPEPDDAALDAAVMRRRLRHFHDELGDRDRLS